MSAHLVEELVRLAVFVGVFAISAHKHPRITITPKLALPLVGLVFAVLNTGLYWVLSVVIRLKHKNALWTFVDRVDVEPTNNHAERELRAFVLWRKRCFGTQSERGNRFAERIMTIAHTARKQQRDVLDFLIESCRACDEQTQPPSLFNEVGVRAAA